VSDHPYWPFYCEENVWWLAQSRGLSDRRRAVVVITNAARRCLLCGQRAAGAAGLVVWDYHVVLVTEASPIAPAEVWDLDSELGMPLALERYLDATFGAPAPAELAPRFRIVEAEAFLARFATDRSHMRDAAGGWLHAPPPWPPPQAPGEAMNLPRYLDLADPIAPPSVDLPGLRRRFAGP
jgi:hypothetical protein